MSEGVEYLKNRSNQAHSRSEEMGLGALVGIVLRRKLLFGLITVVSMAAVTIIHLWLPIYQARSSLIFQSVSSSSLQAVAAKLGTFGIQEDEGKELDRYATRLNAFDFYQMAAREIRKMPPLDMFRPQMLTSKHRLLWNLEKIFNLTPAIPPEALSDDQVADILENWVYFNRVGSDRISIIVKSPDLKSAWVVTNLIAELGAKVLLSEGLTDLDEAEAYIQSQALESEKSIREIESTLAQLKINRGIVSEHGGSEDAAGEASNIQRQLSEARLEAEENSRVIDRLRKELAAEELRDPSAINASIDPKNRYGLPRRILETQRLSELVVLRQSSLRKLLSELIHSHNQGDEQKIFDLHKRMEFQYTLYQELKKEAFQLQMRRIGARNKVKVFERARDGDAQRSDSLPVKLAIAVILSVFGGLPVAMVLEFAHPRVRTGKDLADSGLIYLGGVPVITGRFITERPGHLAKLCRFDTDSEAAMAFIQIRSRMIYYAEQQTGSVQVISVLSALPGEGKSLFSRNLAACFGHMGKKTLLIDCDLRKANTTQYFGTTQELGLGELLTGERKFGQVVHRRILPGLDLISAGLVHTNITDLFAGGAFSQMLVDLREVYDQIVLDTPSIIAVPDAPLICGASDMPILLVAEGRTTRNELEISIDRIHSLYSKDIFAVLNLMTGTQTPLYAIQGGARSRVGSPRTVDIPKARS